MTINYWFLLQQRRLRERFQLATLCRHEYRLQCALYAIRPTQAKYTALAHAEGGQP